MVGGKLRPGTDTQLNLLKQVNERTRFMELIKQRGESLPWNSPSQGLRRSTADATWVASNTGSEQIFPLQANAAA